MINGVMTLSGAWHKLRDDPILKFLIVALSFYGMSTFEGPMMSIKTVNALSHYTDWTDRPRALRRARLGRPDLDGLALLPDPAHVRPQEDVQRAGDRAALLDRDARHRALHRRDVDRRRDAGPDVARRQRRRHAGLHLRRERQGDLPVLRDPPRRRPAVPRRHAADGLERRDDRARRPRAPRAGRRRAAGGATPERRNIHDAHEHSGQPVTRRSRPATS